LDDVEQSQYEETLSPTSV